MKKFTLVVLSLVISLAVVGLTHAQVINFDDIGVPNGAATSMPAGYKGFNWSQLWVGNGEGMVIVYGISEPNGYIDGRVSGSLVAYNYAGNTASISLDSGTFNLNGAYLTAAYGTGLHIDIEGYAGGSLAYSQTVVVDQSGPTWFNFNYNGIDTVSFTSYGGSGGPGSGQNFVLDNLNISIVSPGDINGDGVVDISDVILALRMAIGIDPCQLSLSDLNNDGVCDIQDVILILRKALGLP